MLHKSNRQLFNLNIKTPKRILPERALIIIIIIFGPLLKRHTMTEVISRALYTITNYNVLNSSISPVSSHTGKLT